MKNTYSKSALALMLPAMCWVFSSCQKIDLGDASVASNDDKFSVKISSKSADSDIELPSPLAIYAVNDDGLVENYASVSDGASSATLSLVSGKFTFYAVAGADAGDDDVPENNVVTANEGYFTSPVMRGEEASSVEDDMSLTLSLSYAVASVDVTLGNISADVKAVSVKISTLRETMNLEGEYEGSTTATIDLAKQSDGTTWKSPTVYVFPSVSAPTTLTITQTLNDNTTRSYTASYNAKLIKGTPYHFKGTDTNISNHNLTVNITAEGWDNAIEEELTLIPIESGDGTGTIDADGETYLVNSIPTEAGTVLDGKYILAYVDGNQGLLFSKKEWSGLSANIENIQSTIADYKENDISGWIIPTEEQMEEIKSCYGGFNEAYKKLNSALSKVTKGTDIKFQSRWYLCEGASMKYSFYSDKIIELSGTDEKEDSKYFYLRLVKPVTFKLKQ